MSQETNEQDIGRVPWISTTPVEILEQANKAEKLIQDRLKWTDELRERRRSFVKQARAFDPCAWEKMEGFLGGGNSPPKEYIPSEGMLETNTYVVGLLLRDEDEYVRYASVEYFGRVFMSVRDNIQYPQGTTREEQLAGKYQPLWFDDVMIPLIRRSLFDQYYGVSGTASGLRRVIRPGGIEDIVQVVRQQGTNEWAMNFWRSFVEEGRTNVVPVELLAEVKRSIETDERIRSEWFRKANELGKQQRDKMAEYDAEHTVLKDDSAEVRMQHRKERALKLGELVKRDQHEIRVYFKGLLRKGIKPRFVEEGFLRELEEELLKERDTEGHRDKAHRDDPNN